MAGRPTKYTPELLEKAEHYLNNYGEYGDVMPMLCGLAIAIGVCKDTVQAWSKDEDKAAFSVLVKGVMNSQESVLFNEALKGEFNASIAKLALTKHGYTDKVEQDNTHRGDMGGKWVVEFKDADTPSKS